ncbi:MAG TPA: DNA polymerase IV [Baekduia sp.]|uniref:DNA polymerase IV n=1 Tax=Baekduia sp. TaxID=2600305 RepID=UPI002C553A11|nr:DNA polymerase IV [Baekduia sp.]HMJ34224.1 DNA polymerase IV [Baekduia sp.]
MRSAPSVLHADLDAFFAAVEQRDDPRLRGRPVIVGPGVVLAASYEARAFGVRSAMGGRRARQLCPEAIVVAPRFSVYVEASRAVFAILERTAPTVEPLSIDEAFLDVSGLEHISGTPAEIARRLRREVREQVGLPISVGAATTKHLAKIASNSAKPDGLLVVAPGAERAFLDPLPVQRLWGVGPATTVRLREHGIVTVGQLAGLPEDVLMRVVGRAAGRHLHAVAHNRDPRRVRAGRGRRSFGSQSALGSRGRSPEALDAVAVALVDRVTRRMRAAGKVGRTVVLRLRFSDYSRATRSKTLRRPTATTATVLVTFRGLIDAERETIARRGLTLLGVTVTNLERGDAGVQLELPLGDCVAIATGDPPAAATAGRRGPRPRRPPTAPLNGGDQDALDAAVDAIRDRYGTRALQRATLLARGEQLAPWIMPE